MNGRLTFRPSYIVRALDEGVFLLSERGHRLLTGALYCHIAPLLDGRYSEDEVVELAGVADPAEVYYALALLQEKGYVIEVPAPLPRPTAAYWDGLGCDPSVVNRHLRDVQVLVATFGEVPVAPITEGLGALGLTPGGAEGSFAVALTDDYLRNGLDEFNVESLTRCRPWILAKPLGTVLWIGPVFRPGQTACWECLAYRLRLNRRVEWYVQHRAQEPPIVPAHASISAAFEIGVRAVVLEAAKAIATPAGTDPGATLVTLDLKTLESKRHAVLRLPGCRRCGGEDALTVEPAPVELQSRLKRFTSDGGYRTVDPEETLARYEHHVSPISGVVGFLKPLSTDRGSGIRSYVASHVSALEPRSLRALREALDEVSAGKGISDVQARASALGEALERYSGYFWGDEFTVRSSYRRLGTNAMLPNACMLFSERQYSNRDELNGRGSKFEQVPAPFDESAEILWSPVWSLTDHEFKYLPTEYCYGYFRDPERPKYPRFCMADSNGNAAGNNLEEAILQGFMELVERDAVALWWYNRLQLRAVDFESIESQVAHDMRRRYRDISRDLWILDLTTDLGIPTFAGISRRTDKAEEDLVWGFGAHFDPMIGVLRALTELNQHLPRTSPAGNGSGFDSHPEVSDWYRTAKLADYPYLAPGPTPPRPLCEYGRVWNEDMRDDVRRGQEIVESKGLELLVLEQTRREVGLPAVKVFVPGLRHFRPRFAPGRLYDVPTRLGWLERQLGEDELNPVPYFFP